MDRAAKVKEVSEGAQYVYQQMVDRRSYRVNPLHNSDQTQVICDVGASKESLRQWLDELQKAGWIYSGGSKSTQYILGYVVMRESLFGEGRERTLQEEIELLTSRYSPRERRLVEQVFEILGTHRSVREGKPNLKITPYTRRELLDYWAQFDRAVIVRSLQTFCQISDIKLQHSGYLRGIIRTESMNSDPSSQRIVGVNGYTEAPQRRAAVSHERGKQKQEWIRAQQIARLDYFNSLTKEEQFEFLQKLEEEWEEIEVAESSVTA